LPERPEHHTALSPTRKRRIHRRIGQINREIATMITAKTGNITTDSTTKSDRGPRSPETLVAPALAGKRRSRLMIAPASRKGKLHSRMIVSRDHGVTQTRAATKPDGGQPLHVRARIKISNN